MIKTEITTFGDAVNNIKTEIQNKGQTVLNTDTISSLKSKIENISNKGSMGYSKSPLKEIIEGTIENLYDKVLLYIRPYCFCGCRNLQTARFTKLRKICRHAFNNCVQLKTLILDFYNENNPDEIVRLDNINAFKFTPIEKGNGKIYVNDNLYTKYLADTNWANFSNYIHRVSEYIE